MASETDYERTRDQLEGILAPGEELLDFAFGSADISRGGLSSVFSSSRNGTIFVTDQRVGFFAKSRLGRGVEVADINLTSLGTIQHKTTMFEKSITLQGAGMTMACTFSSREAVETLASLIRELMSEASVPGDSATEQESVVDQLSKLASLHEAGVLSDDEFATVKRRLIEGESN